MARAPRHGRSPVGPLVFVLLLAIVAGAALAGGSALAGDAAVALVSDRDTLLRQAPIRELVRSRVGPAAEVPADPTATAVDLEVSKGETVASVATRLAERGLVRSRVGWLLALYDSGKQDELQAGTHRVSAAMTPRQISDALTQKPPADQATLRIIEGWRLTQIADEVAKVFPHIGAEAFLQAAVVGKRADALLKGLDPATPLEGYLYPDTYFFKPTASADDIVARLLATFDERAGAVLKAAKPGVDLGAYDVIKLASIVEREAQDRAESARIAGVYANRLRIGMKLDADPTIQYAKGSWAELTLDDLQIDSPYNTYRVAGLPPTPICSPGLAAIQAAAAPERHDYLYFVAKGDGSGGHLFAKTLEEQEANRVKVGNR